MTHLESALHLCCTWKRRDRCLPFANVGIANLSLFVLPEMNMTCGLRLSWAGGKRRVKATDALLGLLAVVLQRDRCCQIRARSPVVH